MNLWLEYGQYAIGVCESEEIRTILEKGLSAAGLDVGEGGLLWDVLREYELALLTVLPVDSEQHLQQLQKVVDVFRRQLSVPLLNMEGTYDEWKTFIEILPDNQGIDLDGINWRYSKALKLLDVYRKFEDDLLKDNVQHKSVYLEYLKVVSDPSTKMCLYERALAVLCLDSELWEDYCRYVKKNHFIILYLCCKKNFLEHVFKFQVKN